MYVLPINSYLNRNNYYNNQQNLSSRPNFQAKSFQHACASYKNKLMDIAVTAENIEPETLGKVKNIIASVTRNPKYLDKINSFNTDDIKRIFNYILYSPDDSKSVIKKIYSDIEASDNMLRVKSHKFLEDNSLAFAIHDEIDLFNSKTFKATLDKFYTEMIHSDEYLHETKGQAGVALIDMLIFVSRYEPELWKDKDFQKNIPHLFDASNTEDAKIKGMILDTMIELKNHTPEIWDNPNFKKSLSDFVKTKTKKMAMSRINILKMFEYFLKQNEANWNDSNFQAKIPDMILNPTSYIR
ncbi:MAG: hypothetical protein MJ237_06735 [bacterium]|nr:hypothetical protein [bacterium]